MTDRIMGDSSTFGDVPRQDIDIVAVYDDGNFGVPAPGQVEKLYPHARYGHCFIDVNGSRPDADVRDWETGDKAGSLEQWVIEHNRIHGKNNAVVYCNRATIPEVRRLTGGQILGKHYFLFIATLDGTEYRAHGVIACQNKGAMQTHGHYDSSKVYDDRFWRKTGGDTPKPTPPPNKPGHKPNCRPFQEAVHTAVDGIWGPNTDKAAGALIHAISNEFPYGVQFAQRVVATERDGQWGPKSQTALRNTITLVQKALSKMGFHPGVADGVWGPKTEDAYNKARKACHI
jgi:hypothetical protein